MYNTCGLIKEEVKMRTYSFKEYFELMESFAKLGLTSGNENTEERVQNTKINFVRMKRWMKTFEIDDSLKEEIKNIKSPICWTVITEAWCGDSAQIIPAMAKIAESSEGKIKLQFIFRDDNPEFINKYLTNGGKAIPKLIARNLDAHDIYVWGPRPATPTNIMTQWKNNPQGKTKDDIMKIIHLWYASNQQKEVISELTQLINQFK